jgi:outer membrane lipopolysaccharide assembly protein LptE/RlpB
MGEVGLMTTVFVIACYLLLGCGFSYRRSLDIAAECDAFDPRHTVGAIFRWIATWPLWIGRK